jgi:transcriptional regulator with XRE-family HTH domain
MTDSKEEKTIGEVIAEARKDAGLSLRTVAAKIPINYSYLADIEKNRRTPSEKVLQALSQIHDLNLDFDYLMAYKGKLSQETEKYLKSHPSFGKLIRLISDYSLTESELNDLISIVKKSPPRSK